MIPSRSTPMTFNSAPPIKNVKDQYPFIKTKPRRSILNGINYTFLILMISSFSLGVSEVSQKMKGRRSLSMDQFLSLKRDAFSILNRVSMEAVACMSKEASRLCSDKNCCFFVIRCAPKTLTSVSSIRLFSQKSKEKGGCSYYLHPPFLLKTTLLIELHHFKFTMNLDAPEKFVTRRTVVLSPPCRFAAIGIVLVHSITNLSYPTVSILPRLFFR